LEGEINDAEERFEALLNPSWHNLTESSKTESEATTQKINEETSKNTNSEQDPDEESGEQTCEEQVDTSKIPKGGPGRPKLLRTGKRGRPRKLYHETKHREETDEPSSWEEIRSRTDKQA